MKLETEYKEWIRQSSIDHSSRIVFALDIEAGIPSRLFRKATALIDDTVEHFCAVKFGRHTVLNLGTSLTSRLTSRIHRSGIPCIIDDKLSDIDTTNLGITQAYHRLGFDAIIVNPSTGWEGGLEPVFQTSHKTGQGVIVLVYMSHPGASETFGQPISSKHSGKSIYQYEVYARRAVSWNADGAVVGATRPRIIRNVKPVLADKVPIYSPGVGTQGGSLRTAARAGTDYFIIGRSVALATSPESAAEKYAKEST